jgi:hypothetical protein
MQLMYPPAADAPADILVLAEHTFMLNLQGQLLIQHMPSTAVCIHLLQMRLLTSWC